MAAGGPARSCRQDPSEEEGATSDEGRGVEGQTDWRWILNLTHSMSVSWKKRKDPSGTCGRSLARMTEHLVAPLTEKGNTGSFVALLKTCQT